GVLYGDRIVVCPEQPPPFSEFVEQTLVINVEAKLAQRRVKVGPIDQQCNSIFPSACSVSGVCDLGSPRMKDNRSAIPSFPTIDFRPARTPPPDPTAANRKEQGPSLPQTAALRNVGYSSAAALVTRPGNVLNIPLSGRGWVCADQLRNAEHPGRASRWLR